MADFNKRLDNEFQSTPPVKAATLSRPPASVHGGISIHAAREGGDAAERDRRIAWYISIHAAREGGDIRYKPVLNFLRHFNPRRP